MADSKTQEKVREAVARLQEDVAFCVANTRERMYLSTEDVRTLLAAYTKAEADLAEARKALEGLEKGGTVVSSLVMSLLAAPTPTLTEGATTALRVHMLKNIFAADLLLARRALATFHNKGNADG